MNNEITIALCVSYLFSYYLNTDYYSYTATSKTSHTIIYTYKPTQLSNTYIQNQQYFLNASRELKENLVPEVDLRLVYPDR